MERVSVNVSFEGQGSSTRNPHAQKPSGFASGLAENGIGRGPNQAQRMADAVDGGTGRRGLSRAGSSQSGQRVCSPHLGCCGPVRAQSSSPQGVDVDKTGSIDRLIIALHVHAARREQSLSAPPASSPHPGDPWAAQVERAGPPTARAPRG